MLAPGSSPHELALIPLLSMEASCWVQQITFLFSCCICLSPVWIALEWLTEKGQAKGQQLDCIAMASWTPHGPFGTACLEVNMPE